MNQRVAFTTKRLESLACPDGADRAYFYDASMLGLALCVTKAGAKTFYIYRRLSGRPTRIRLGSWPHELGLDDARKEAAKTNGDIARGIDPRQAKRAARAERTFSDLFTDYIEKHIRPKRKARTLAQYERQFDLYLKGWKGKRISHIDADAVHDLHARIGRENGHYIANRVLSLVRAVFNFGRRESPTKGIKPFAEIERDRFLQGDELPHFFAALEGEAEPFPDFFLTCLYTGARRSNVQAMGWDDIHLGRREWTIRGAVTKNGKPVTVPLCPEVCEILSRRLAQRNGSPWVFPGRGKSGHLEDPKTAWKRILAKAGITDLRLHDLRRSLGSWMAGTGASLPIIGKTLGHKSQAATAVYARLALDPVRSAVNTATAAIAEAAKPKGNPEDARPSDRD